MVIGLLGLALLFMLIQFSDLWNWIISAIRSVFVPVIFAYLIALIIFPLIRYLEKKGIGPRGLSLAIVFILTAGLIFSFFYFVVPLLLSEITNFFENDVNKIIDYLTVDLREEFILGRDMYDQIYNYVVESDLITNSLQGFIPSLIAGFSNVAIPIITTVLLLPILLIYYLLDYEMIGEKIRSIIPQKHEKNIADLGSKLNQTVGAYLRGQLMLMLAIGTAATIIYKLIGLKYFFVFGILVGITNIIPYFGMILAAVPPIIYATIAGSGPGPLLVLTVNIVLQFFEGNFFQPLIMGHQLKIHPLVIIMSILFFGSLFGAIGVIFASPIAASIRVFYHFFKDLKNQNQPGELSAGVTKT